MILLRVARSHLRSSTKQWCQIRRLSVTTDAPPPWTSRLVDSDDGYPLNVSLHNVGNAKYTNDADGRRTVLCLPGALGTGPSDFEALLSGGLGDEFAIVAMDPRGLGGSDSATRTFPLEFYLRDALDGAAVMERLGFSRYSVLGWSDGANSAIHLAGHPTAKDAVERLVVWGGNSYVTEKDIKAYEAVRDVRNWSRRMREEKARVHGGEGALQELNDRATDGWIRMYTEGAGDVCLGALHRVICPTLVLHGSKDVISHVDHARYIAKHVSDAALVLLAEGKHNLHQRHADTFHELVRGFLLETDAENGKGDGEPPVEPMIDEIAYAFMGSKALSTALKAGVFDAIHNACTCDVESDELNDYATFEDVERHSEVKGERLRTLLSACAALRLVHQRVRRGRDAFRLSPASADQLVRSSKHYWGDYISNQVDGQFYSRMRNLDVVMRMGNSASDGYEAWFEEDPDAAREYTLAQHNGSLATASALHRRLPDLAERFPRMQMLDVGGGSGAFSIVTAQRLPDAECVVLDLPSVAKVADEIIAREEESVRGRVRSLSLSANGPGEWRGLVGDRSFDVVLMSYVSGSIPAEALPSLYRNAFRALRPGGMAIVHDFFVDNNGKGPKNAALWALAHCSVNPEGMGLRPNRIIGMLAEEGFIAPKVESLIPKTTQLIVATKPIDA